MKIEHRTIQDAISLSDTLLNQESKTFTRDKNLIKNAFDEGEIDLQIILLDYLYSTNLSKNKFAKESVSRFVEGEMYREFLQELLSETQKVTQKRVNEVFGEKFGEKQQQAVSFLSKHSYFATDFNFPIYDSLVIKSCKDLFNTRIKKENFFEILKEKTDIYNVQYEDLDAFLWLYGKLKNKSYTTFLSQKEYENLPPSIKEEAIVTIDDFVFQVEKILGNIRKK